MRRFPIVLLLASLSVCASAQVGHRVAGCYDPKTGADVSCDQGSDSPSAPAMPTVSPEAATLMNGAAGAFGSALGAGLVAPLPPADNRYGHMRRDMLNQKDDDSSDPNASGVDAAHKILSEGDDTPPPPNPEPAPAPKPRTAACPNDPAVVCLAGGGKIVDLSTLGENERGHAVDVPAERPAEKAVVAGEPTTESETGFREAWDKFTAVVSAADLAHSAAEIFNKIPEEYDKASERFGLAVNAVGLTDAYLDIRDGKNAQPAGALTGMIVGAAGNPGKVVAAGAQACGYFEGCSNAAAKGANAAVNTPIQPLADFSKGTVSGSLVEERALRDGVSEEEARRRVEADVQSTADRIKSNGSQGITEFTCGFIGSKKGVCK